MGTDQSLPPDARTSDIQVERGEIAAAIGKYREGAAALRKNAGWSTIADAGLVGGNGGFPSLVQFGRGCADLDRCNLVIAERIEGQAKKLQAYIDRTEAINAEHGDSLRQATA